MRTTHDRSFADAIQPSSMLMRRVGCALLVVVLFWCSSLPHTDREAVYEETNPLLPRYSLIFIIHGDGDYLYHDAHGQAQRADMHALAGAIEVAVRNPQAEVFIFHQHPQKHAFFLFPLRDGQFYYYRNGSLVAREPYRRDTRQPRFAPETELYHRFRRETDAHSTKMFLYFGHEIPEYTGVDYDASYSKREFTIRDLADGLATLTRDTTTFDLVVLATCFGGTPHTIAAIAPFARYIIASPENLHLSYFDLQSLEQLDPLMREEDMGAFAIKFARSSFDRLAEDILTTITVAVYDVDRVRRYVNSVDSLYSHTLNEVKNQAPGSVEHCDCAEEPGYVLPGMSEGVDVFYRPARFGRVTKSTGHSGWECWRRKDTPAVATRSINEVR